jgi:hypothetical protein
MASRYGDDHDDVARARGEPSIGDESADRFAHADDDIPF